MKHGQKDAKLKIHFIGIGGTGMACLGGLCHELGLDVSGCDCAETPRIEKLRNAGVHVYCGHSPAHVLANNPIVVYSGAIPDDHPELVCARRNGCRCMSRGAFMGYLTSESKLVAVAGTHGKSTTTSMVAKVLLSSGLSPTVLVGASCDGINGGYVCGSSDLVVCEACEYLDSFLSLSPYVGIILNIDNDHLDYFGTIDNLKASFLKFANKCSYVVINKDDPNAFEISKQLESSKVVYFSVSPSATSRETCARNVKFNSRMCASFNILDDSLELSLCLGVVGMHNVMDSLAAYCACKLVGATPSTIVHALEQFRGADRRFQFIGSFNGVSVFDDFAHHPTEIRATLSTAKQMSFSRVVVVFQPHTFSRTYMLLNDLAAALKLADAVILTEILPVRDVNTYGVSSTDLANKIPGAVVMSDSKDVAGYLKTVVAPGDMVLTMGGGDIYKYIPQIVDKLKEL